MRYFLGNNIIARSAKMDVLNMEFQRLSFAQIHLWRCGWVNRPKFCECLVAVSKFLVKSLYFYRKFCSYMGLTDISLYDSNKSRILQKANADVSKTFISIKSFVENIKNSSYPAIDYDAAENVKIVEYFYSRSKIH